MSPLFDSGLLANHINLYSVLSFPFNSRMVRLNSCPQTKNPTARRENGGLFFGRYSFAWFPILRSR